MLSGHAQLDLDRLNKSDPDHIGIAVYLVSETEEPHRYPEARAGSKSWTIGILVPLNGIWIRIKRIQPVKPNTRTGSLQDLDEIWKPDRMDPVRTENRDTSVNMFSSVPVKAIFVNSPKVI